MFTSYINMHYCPVGIVESDIHMHSCEGPPVKLHILFLVAYHCSVTAVVNGLVQGYWNS